jgi:hypothetical protein
VAHLASKIKSFR